ncbi:hypothetical protein BJV85_002351 [Clostridium acetobutylicum]|uniref:Ankyrin repeats containing protein n=1 Tax=Clostridium acetobutylicum (strain ATCC 824 / DSM 792 / JCM 1419 / IAM 19013 / LMG 5710 / NBRC 13948 / NRRL B-527 / VKM B-1787 / 2291 / W) TaxID=272562 RepID=Q97IJ6_CLOAB|nr:MULTISPECIES: suppressor of fused domain protein [Clostridium]AAK79611.1 Ankyrin repeats containing protein [Clostridium acetobutylicum ATCC 824]ADZ20695.1 Ankyrin repeats containing protein [Clostridium acetobutylicum EA 2018]AEI31919.1 ankyrin repeat-containing protein [Clostridium acetobutylicum DSM 1731]AWV79950.1 hypothetical protein DK921_07540 [Clostridium acetobutylicum]MBC2394064.1 hypothetical protein [Clostridium acetobutylicum]
MNNLSWSDIKRSTFNAIKKGDLKLLANMIDKYPKVIDAYNSSGYSLLHVAAEQDNVEVLEYLYNNKIDVNITRKNDDGCVTPIHGAVDKNLIGNVEWLIAHGAKIDTGNGIHATPLIGAAFNGNLEMVKLLLKNGADINAFYDIGEGINKTRITPLIAAEMEGHTETCEYLCKNGARKLDAKKYELTQIKNQHDEILQYLQRYFGNVNKTLSEVIPASNVSVNLNIMRNTENDKFITIVTTGMSDCPMDDSDEAFEERFAELIIKLPKDWLIDKNNIKDVNNYWPLGWIRRIAHIPHLYDGWIGKDIIIPNGEPPQPFAPNTKLSCIMICQPDEKELHRFTTSKGNIINLYTLIPIYKEERNMALIKGCKYLRKRMEDRGIDEILNITRENVGLSADEQ